MGGPEYPFSLLLVSLLSGRALDRGSITDTEAEEKDPTRLVSLESEVVNIVSVRGGQVGGNHSA